LYPRQRFAALSRELGTPGWAIGTFSDFDGRIRVATGNLGRDVPPGLENILTHELVHAFVDARTRGLAPRDLDEGLAQYLSGHRSNGVSPEQAALFVKGGRVEVYLFYRAALSFVQFLIERYRQTTMIDLLAALGETRDVDSAFRAAYRESYEEARDEWLKQLH
jgi:hypothetical protein